MTTFEIYDSIVSEGSMNEQINGRVPDAVEAFLKRKGVRYKRIEDGDSWTTLSANVS